jgi:phage-related baseplate assembly protein
MNLAEKTSIFQKAIDTVEALSPEEQNVLIHIIQNRLKQQHRDELLKAVAESENDYEIGNVHRGTVADLMAELDD